MAGRRNGRLLYNVSTFVTVLDSRRNVVTF
jgi:hypothetical protein